MVSNFLKLYCPYCDIINWLDCGDPNDLTLADPEGLICWNCKKHSLFDSDGDLLTLKTHRCNCDTGMETPE